MNSIEDALKLSKKYAEFNFVTVDGDYIDQFGIIEGGSTPRLDDSVFGRKQLLQNLKEDFSKRENDLIAIKKKIDEGMKNDMVDHRNLGQPANLTMGPPNKRPLDNNDRGMGGPSNSGPADLSESPRKRHKMDDGGNSQDLPDSPGSGEMVIDESARPDSAHSQKTTSPAPHPSDYSAYRGGLPPGSGNLPQMPPRSSPSGGMPNYGALNASRGGPPPPATSSGPSGPPPQSQLPPPTGGAPPGARYEPLSDDD